MNIGANLLTESHVPKIDTGDLPSTFVRTILCIDEVIHGLLDFDRYAIDIRNVVLANGGLFIHPC